MSTLEKVCIYNIAMKKNSQTHIDALYNTTVRTPPAKENNFLDSPNGIRGAVYRNASGIHTLGV